MKKYSDYAPTQFDLEGYALDDQQDWLVADVIQTRDSNILEAVNFDCFLKGLGGEGVDVEVHRFGHWGPGWYEIILIRPGTKAEDVAYECERALADYPVLCDNAYSEALYEAMCDCWDGACLRDRVQACSDNGISIFAARRDELPENIEIDIY